MSIFEFLVKVQRLQSDYIWEIPISIICGSIIIIEVGDSESKFRWYVDRGDDSSSLIEKLLNICQHIDRIKCLSLET